PRPSAERRGAPCPPPMSCSSARATRPGASWPRPCSTTGARAASGPSARAVPPRAGSTPLPAGGDDPAEAPGPHEQRRRAFRRAFRELDARIKLFASLHVEELDARALRKELESIGRSRPLEEGAR